MPRRVVVAVAGPDWLRWVLVLGAGLYLASLFLNGAGSALPRRSLPASALYFVQTSCLFPRAGLMAIDYRLEGWDCEADTFREVDPRPYFPIHSDDKESRFQRVGHFHRRNRPVMEALERYVVAQEAALLGDAGRKLGGIRLSSLRIPHPEPGAPVPRWSRRPLSAYPAEQIKPWYFTPARRRQSVCEGQPTSVTAPPDSSSSDPVEGHDG